ncbi:hypothetical protein OAK38_06065 [Verrucomicrobia bacterium]|nr:hypothetical protein [Verrucomicrobiota bacterium]
MENDEIEYDYYIELARLFDEEDIRCPPHGTIYEEDTNKHQDGDAAATRQKRPKGEKRESNGSTAKGDG